MKILLVYAPFCTPVSPPYSITNLFSFLKNNSHHEVKVLDLNLQFHWLKFPEQGKYFCLGKWDDYEKIANEYQQLTKKVYSENNRLVVEGKRPEFFAELLEKITSEKADLVAFSVVYSSQAFYVQALLKELKDLKNVITVIGGPAINGKLAANHVFKNEIEFLEFIEKRSTKQKSIDHTRLKVDYPLDFSSYDGNNYFTPKAVIPLKTSTTCYWQRCTFCSHYAKVPYYQIPLEVIKKTIRLSGKKTFFLIDDMIPAKRLVELGELFGSLGVEWACQLRPTKEFNEEVLKKCYDGGLRMVIWGVESGNDRVLGLIDKGTNTRDVSLVLQRSHQAGIKNVTYIMFGFPGETPEEFMGTILFLQNNAEFIDLISPSIFGLQKGTIVYGNPEVFGITQIVEEERTVLEPKITYTSSGMTSGMSIDHVKRLKKKVQPIFLSINKYPTAMNFFREHMLCQD